MTGPSFGTACQRTIHGDSIQDSEMYPTRKRTIMDANGRAGESSSYEFERALLALQRVHQAYVGWERLRYRIRNTVNVVPSNSPIRRAFQDLTRWVEIHRHSAHLSICGVSRRHGKKFSILVGRFYLETPEDWLKPNRSQYWDMPEISFPKRLARRNSLRMNSSNDVWKLLGAGNRFIQLLNGYVKRHEYDLYVGHLKPTRTRCGCTFAKCAWTQKAFSS